MKIFRYWDCFERYQINYTYRAGSDLGDVYQMRRKENRKIFGTVPVVIQFILLFNTR